MWMSSEGGTKKQPCLFGVTVVSFVCLSDFWGGADWLMRGYLWMTVRAAWLTMSSVGGKALIYWDIYTMAFCSWISAWSYLSVGFIISSRLLYALHLKLYISEEQKEQNKHYNFAQYLSSTLIYWNMPKTNPAAQFYLRTNMQS